MPYTERIDEAECAWYGGQLDRQRDAALLCMENAAEYIVRLYLEQQGYTVRTNQRFYYSKRIRTAKGLQWQRTPIEVDVLAIHNKKKDKLLGEVKTWFGSLGTGCHSFKALSPSRWNPRSDRFKVINNRTICDPLFQAVRKIYGGGFRYSLFLGKIVPRDRSKVLRYLKTLIINRRKVEVTEFDVMTRALIQQTLTAKSEYDNDPVLITMRVLQFYNLLNPNLQTR